MPAEAGDIIITVKQLRHKGTLVRRLNNGNVIITDPAGLEWEAEAITVYQLKRRHIEPQPPSPPSLGEGEEAPNGSNVPSTPTEPREA